MRWTIIATLPLTRLCWPELPVDSAETCVEDTAGATETRDVSLVSAPLAFEGELAGDRAGEAVTPITDLDGDNLPEIAVGAPYTNDQGAVYLISGAHAAAALADGTGALDLALDASIVVPGGLSSELGATVRGGYGLLEGDGPALVIGAPGTALGGVAAVGALCVTDGLADAFLSDEPGPRALTTHCLTGADGGDRVGAALSVGDPNDEDDDDAVQLLAVGAPGDATMPGLTFLFISRVDTTVDLVSEAADLTLRGEHAGDGFGSAVAVGEIDGDGQADLVVGSPGADVYALPEAGRSYLILGDALLQDPAENVANLAEDGLATRFLGSAMRTRSGASVALGAETPGGSGTDLDNDGLDDLIIGTSCPEGCGESDNPAGRVYIMHSSSIYDGDISLVDADVTFLSSLPSEGPVSLDVATNPDGTPALVVGIADLRLNTQGTVYVTTVPECGTHLLEDADVAIYGEATRDEAGFSVASIGDLDGGGLADLLIGAPGRYDDAGDEVGGRGAVYLMPLEQIWP